MCKRRTFSLVHPGSIYLPVNANYKFYIELLECVPSKFVLIDLQFAVWPKRYVSRSLPFCFSSRTCRCDSFQYTWTSETFFINSIISKIHRVLSLHFDYEIALIKQGLLNAILKIASILNSNATLNMERQCKRTYHAERKFNAVILVFNQPTTTKVNYKCRVIIYALNPPSILTSKLNSDPELARVRWAHNNLCCQIFLYLDKRMNMKQNVALTFHQFPNF